MRLWWIGVLFFCVKAVLAQGAMCEVTELGNPCQQGGVATLGRSESSPNHGVGNPVDRRNGNKYQRDTDLPSLADAPGLELVRHYNALDPRTGALGRGWSWSYDTRLYWMGARVQVLQADGSRLTFHCDLKQHCVGHAHDSGVITRDGQGWQWQWPFGKCLRFDEPGRLLGWSIATASKSGQLAGRCGEALTVRIVRHHAPSRWHGELARVTDIRSNQSLYFIYASKPAQQPIPSIAQTTTNQITASQATPSQQAEIHATFNQTKKNLITTNQTLTAQRSTTERIVTPSTSTAESKGVLVAVESPLGVFRYAYDADGLVEVLRPDGMRRRYHRETFLQAGHVHAVTGISLVDRTGMQTLRTHTWQYNRGGRVQKFIAGPPELIAAGLPTALPNAALGLAVEHDSRRVIRHLSLHDKGWPGLRLWFDAAGRLTRWQSQGVSSERLAYQGQNFLHERFKKKIWTSRLVRSQQETSQHESSQQETSQQRTSQGADTPPQSPLIFRKFGEQDLWRWRFDAFGRVRSLTARSTVAEPVDIRVGWRGRHPVVLAHPEETQYRRFNAAGDLRERVVFRRTTDAGLSKVFRPEWNYREAFTYDAQGRRLTHALPEGGVLHYHWSHEGLRAIEWKNMGGERRKILDVGPLGLLHGNGLFDYQAGSFLTANPSAGVAPRAATGVSTRNAFTVVSPSNRFRSARKAESRKHHAGRPDLANKL